MPPSSMLAEELAGERDSYRFQKCMNYSAFRIFPNIHTSGNTHDGKAPFRKNKVEHGATRQSQLATMDNAGSEGL